MKQSISKIAISVALSAFLFNGCGGGSSVDRTTSQNNIPNNPNTTLHVAKDKISSRAVSRDYYSDLLNTFLLKNIPWEYDNHEGLKVHLDKYYLYINFTHNSKAPNFQFFIDSDNNPKTGNLSEAGSDYVVENGYLYKAGNPKKWDWQRLAKVDVAIDPNKSQTVKIPLRYLKDLNVVFRVNAEALNNNWIPIVSSPVDGSKSIYTQKNSIDWDKVPTYTSKDNTIVKIYNSFDKLYFYVEEPTFKAHTQIFIDSDNNKYTGYKSDSFVNLGRDYLIEDSTIYRYTGASGWGWEKAGDVERVRKYEDGKFKLIFTLSKDILKNLSNSIKVAVETSDQGWKNTLFINQNYIPNFNLGQTPPPPPPVTEGKLEISEVLAANTHTILDPDYYNFSDYIEIHNGTNHSIDLSGYKLSDKLNEAKWTIPNGTTIGANSYLIFWADEKDSGLHTNFKLKMGGEAVALFDKNGKVVSAFEFKKQLPDISITKKGDKIVYMHPTPNKPNSTAYDNAILSKTPTFSQDSGFVSNTNVTLSGTGTIYYTTDGSIPTIHSKRYTYPIHVDKTMSIRAINVENGKFESPVVTKTYVVGEDDIDIPVITITTDDKYFFDDKIGIYTVGTNGELVEGCSDDVDGIVANYMRKWKRPAHMTFFETDKKVVLSQDVDVKISGTCSRTNGQKSLILEADDKYGDDKFRYQIFPDKPIDEFEKIKLRSSGQDATNTHLRDALTNMMTKGQMHLNYEAYRPSIVFLNGKFWGIYNIREKMGARYIKNNYGLSKKKIDMVEDFYEVDAGSSEDFDNLLDYLKDHSLANDSNYNYVLSKIDIDNYIDYMITNIFIANSDWPGGNIVYWKAKKDGAKWQWLLHDTDHAYANYPDESDVNYNAIKQASTKDGKEWPNPEISTRLFRRLLENPKFKAKFKARMLEELDTTFNPNRTTKILQDLADKIDPYMDRQISKWSDWNMHNKDDWKYELNRVKEFLKQRPAVVKEHLNQI